MAENHPAPEAGQYSWTETRDCGETKSEQRKMNVGGQCIMRCPGKVHGRHCMKDSQFPNSKEKAFNKRLCPLERR